MARIADVAKRAGVSTATVSRVLNGIPVREDLVALVRAAAEDLNYTPDRTARSLRRRHSDLLTLIVPDISNPFFTMVARSVEDSASEAGYSIVICNTDNLSLKEARYLQIAEDENMAGVIIAPVSPIDAQNEASLDRLLQQGRAVVAIERGVQLPVDEVIFDNHLLEDKTTHNLVEQGYRMGSIAASMLLERIDGLESPPRSVNLTLTAASPDAEVIKAQRSGLTTSTLLSRNPTQTADEILDVLAMRQVLEVGFLPAVISAIEDHHLRTLRGLVERMEEWAAEGVSFAAEDRLFHQTLYAPLHNPSLLSLIGRFWDLFANLDERDFRHTESAADTVRHHINILEAVERRDVTLAQFHMNAHFYDVVNIVKASWKLRAGEGGVGDSTPETALRTTSQALTAPVAGVAIAPPFAARTRS